MARGRGNGPGGGGGNGGGPGGAGNPNEVLITVVVNGSPVVVTANRNAPLRTVIPEALRLSNNLGQPPENWELKDEQGNVLNLDQRIAEYNFPPTVQLFLSLRAGVAGAR